MEDELEKGSDCCSAVNCPNSLENGNARIDYFKFPNDKERCKVWILNCHRQDLLDINCEYVHNRYSLCSFHFDGSQFIDSRRKILRSNAVPTIFKFSNLAINSEKEENSDFDEFTYPGDIVSVTLECDDEPFDSTKSRLEKGKFDWLPSQARVRKKHLYKCTDCDQVFPWKKNLRRHKKLHVGQPPVVCEVCNKRFAVERCLFQHMPSHLGERFLCNLCEDTFTTGDLLREHLVNHITQDDV